MQHEISAILASTNTTISIEKAHIMIGHHDKERMHKISLELGWPLKKGPMMSCKACSVRKARQLVINKHVDNCKKATRADKRIFSDLATIKAPQESGITIPNRNWYIVVDQYTGNKESEFYSTKSDFVEWMCKKFSDWKIMVNQYHTFSTIMHQRMKF